MTADPLAAALQELAVARKRVKQSSNPQIQNREDRDLLSATAYAWFKSHRDQISADPQFLDPVNKAYQTILDATDRNTTKTAYLQTMAEAKHALVALRGHVLTAGKTTTTVEAAPNFSPLVGDPVMRGILERRWQECQKCLGAGADLAAIVMMGGLLEALFVARANKMTNKGPLFKCKATPLDSKTKKALELPFWTLSPYVDVGHELGWITKPAKDVAGVLREYRNYVHPEKERTNNIVLSPHDSAMLWDVTKNLARQVLASALTP